MRQLRMPLELHVYDKAEAHRKLEQLLQLRDEKCSKEKTLRSNRVTIQVTDHFVKQVELPSLRILTVRLFVTAMVDCGHFWAQYRDADTQRHLEFLNETINSNQARNFEPVTGDIYIGKILLAPYVEGPNVINYYRAKIEEIREDGFKVFFIDYGNREIITDRSSLKEIDALKIPDLINIPAQAFECALCEIRPSLIESGDGKWTDKARRWFTSEVSGQDLVARIYSVVQNVVRLELIKRIDSGMEISINEELIKTGLGEPAEESYISKKNHELRMKFEMSGIYDNTDISEDIEFLHLTMKEVGKISSSEKPTQKISLHGPFSPLETSYSGMTHLSSFRRIRIDRDSVNSVILDAEPQDKHTRMLVSSYIGLNPDGSTINAKNTTLMPNIHGLPALLTLIFAPCAEFRTDTQRKQYTGALCGLGYDDRTGESLHPDHDIELVFETSFDEEDIIVINSIRMGINLLLGTESSMNINVPRVQKKIRDHFLNLLSRERKSIEPKEFRHKYKWKRIDDEYLLKSELEGTLGDCPYVLPLHKAVKLTEDMIQIMLQEHIRELHMLARKKSQGIDVNKCRLCGVTTKTIQDLRDHLQEHDHKSKELKLFED